MAGDRVHDSHSNDSHSNDSHSNDSHLNDSHSNDSHPNDSHLNDSHTRRLVDRIRSLSAGVDVASVVVGIDGRSGAGKSTLAAEVLRALAAVGTVGVSIEGDQFYAGGSASTWDRRSAQDKADQVIDWRRQRAVLVALRDHGTATWRPFDWEAADWDAPVAPLLDRPVTCDARDVVLLEGAYSCRPELHDLLDLRVLLDPPADVRRAQLLAREGDAYREDWEARWSEAEEHYFGAVMPPERFDLVLRRSEP